MTLKRLQKYFFILPLLAVLVSLLAILLWGLKPGIDLRGGSLLEISFPEGRPDLVAVQEKVDTLGFGEVRIVPSEDTEFILRQRELSVTEKATLDDTLAEFGITEEVQFNSVGPSIGLELMEKAKWAIGLVVITTILFIAFAFRGISYPVSAWKYGAVAIITLVHDVLIPTGLFAFLGHLRGAEVGGLFIVALLTILGISINDTIVIFDRIRENLNINKAQKKVELYADVVWRSVSQTITRSFNTSFTVVLVLLTLYVLGPDATKDFALTLSVGMIAGTYSSIFLASPLLVLIEKYQKKRKPPEEVK